VKDETKVRVQASQSAIYQSQGSHKALSPWQDLQAQEPRVNELEFEDLFDEQYYEDVDPFGDLLMANEEDLWMTDEEDYGQDNDFEDLTNRYSPRAPIIFGLHMNAIIH